MKTKTTLLLLAAGLGFFGFMRFYEKKHPPTREAAAREVFLLPMNRDNVEGIVISRRGRDVPIELKRKGSRWELESPVKDRADQRAVSDILARCESLSQEATIPAKKHDTKRFEEFGLANPTVSLKLLGKNAPPELLFGNNTAVEGKIYVRLDGKDNVYVTGTDLRALLPRNADALRDHQLTGLDATLANRLLFKTASGEIALTKTGDHWGLDKPIKGRAEDMRVTEFVEAILNTPISAFAENNSLSVCGLSEPRGSVTIWSLGEENPVTLQLGAHDEKTDQTYARLSNRNAIFLLPKQIERILTVIPNDMRDRHLLRVDMDLVDRIAIEPTGKPSLLLKRHQEDWVRVDRKSTNPVNPAKVQALVKTLQTRLITDFVADIASDLPKYGLDHPRLRVAFSSYSSENTAESSAGERPLLTVAFGNIEGKTVYARLENEPFVVSVDRSLLDEISTDSAQWRPLSVFNFNPEQIVALEVTTSPAKTISLKREGSAWQTEGADGQAQSVNVQSLVNTLAKLNAIRWDRSDSGAVKSPTETIAFQTADGKSGKLILGSSSGENGCQAMIDGDTASFALSAPDESALRLPLVEP